ncbi:MAG TPA: TrkA family potassium uptake protein, partial [Arachnia sp.]|nr:TrkA family potassium uptake protein [Arachnia sp.]
MRVAIAGAGNVGRSIARELIANGHQVLLIDRDPRASKGDSVPGASWFHADACELQSLEQAELEAYDVAIAATGDDKSNLVFSLLAKTEFGVPRTVGRVNHPGNEWMFDAQWGVDVSVSTPRMLSALVEEAVSTGDLVRLMTFKRSTTNLSEFTLPDESRLVGVRVRDIAFPGDAVLVAIIRDGLPLTPERDR